MAISYIFITIFMFLDSGGSHINFIDKLKVIGIKQNLKQSQHVDMMANSTVPQY